MFRGETNGVFKLAFKVTVSWMLLLPYIVDANTINTEAPPSDDLINELLAVKHVQTQIEIGTDKSSSRLVKLSVSYPIGESDDAIYPLIVFSHGHALDQLSYYNLTEYWVARGYVVVAPLHLDSGGDLALVSKISKKVGSDWIGASRLIELNAVIDNVDEIMAPLSDFKGRATNQRVIAAGHSYGALSSQQIAGAALEQQGNSIFAIPDTLVNDKVVAVVAISPPGLMPKLLSEATWKEFNAPQLVVTGPNDFFPHIWPSYEDHFVSYWTAKTGHNYLLVLDEMDHYLGNLIGRLERPGPPQKLALQNLSEISLIFIQHYMNNQKLSDEQRSIISERSGVLRFEHR